MIWRETGCGGLFLIEAAPVRDARGAFTRLYCRDTFRARGIDFVPAQVSLSTNDAAHTLRGMHFQTPPAAERKLIRCMTGAVHDVVIDLRPDSPTRGQWRAFQLSAENALALFVPAGFAHGFLTLTADAAVEYMIDVPHAPELASGVRWNDPAFAIHWPALPRVISARDRDWPDHGG